MTPEQMANKLHAWLRDPERSKKLTDEEAHDLELTIVMLQDQAHKLREAGIK
jgi:hypothetical protein